jgi:hypothetical protein
MEQTIVLFSAPDPQDDARVIELLQELSHVDVQTRTETKLLEGRVILPFIETETGDRYFGIDSIERFVERERSKLTGST